MADQPTDYGIALLTHQDGSGYQAIIIHESGIIEHKTCIFYARQYNWWPVYNDALDYLRVNFPDIDWDEDEPVHAGTYPADVPIEHVIADTVEQIRDHKSLTSS